MKLKNKKTGEIVEWFNKTNGVFPDSLTKLNEEWEDYEEPKDINYWYIDDLGRIQFSSAILDENEKHPNNWMIRKLFGNYFDTREEAEKAVEKLKAWKRLKDKGFEFCGTDCINTSNVIYFEFVDKPLTKSEAEEAERELEICFGDEE